MPIYSAMDLKSFEMLEYASANKRVSESVHLLRASSTAEGGRGAFIWRVRLQSPIKTIRYSPCSWISSHVVSVSSKKYQKRASIWASTSIYCWRHLQVWRAWSFQHSSSSMICLSWRPPEELRRGLIAISLVTFNQKHIYQKHSVSGCQSRPQDCQV